MNLREFFQKHKVLIFVFFLAVVVRLCLFFFNLNFNHGNLRSTIIGQDGYYQISENIVAGNGFTFDKAPRYAPDPLRPPVWPYIMALILWMFGSFVPVVIIQITMGSLIPVFGVYLARRIVSSRLALWVGILLALEPNLVLLSFVTISETCFTFLFMIFVIFLIRYVDQQTTRNIVWASVFLGLAVLVKPTVQFFIIIVPIALFLLYRKNLSKTLLKHCAYFVIICLLLISHWVYRNYQEFGAFGISGQPAFNLYSVLVPTVLSIEKGTQYEPEHQAIQRVLDERGDAITLTNSSKYINESLSIFSQHKVAFLTSMGISVVTFFTHDGMLTVLGASGFFLKNNLEKPALVLLFTDPAELLRNIVWYAKSPGLLIFLGRLFWIAITFSFFAGAWFYFRKEKFSPTAWLMFGIVLYFALITTANGYGMNARFRVPVNSLIFIFAVYGVSVFWQKIRARLSNRGDA